MERDFIAEWHYSRKVVSNSSIRLGCFYKGRLIGTVSFGRIINCVQIFENADNREGLELNRLAMVDEAPKNSESWFLMRSIWFIKKKYEWLKFIHTWADGLRCQGGTIYKACGFAYVRKIPIERHYILPDGSAIHQIAFDKVYLKKYYEKLKDIKGRLERVQAVFGPKTKILTGGNNYQYIYTIDKNLEFRLKPMPYEKASKN